MSDSTAAGCIHSPWVCFYERVSDGAIQAFCQRCKAIGVFRPNRADAERALNQPSIGDYRRTAPDAEAARREALEEAARIVEGWETVAERLWIAQAIRSLSPSHPAPEEK